jgi:beta-N-acetylhexosaminidase
MAIGATGDPSLAERVGAAMGREMRALGINLDYAPACDVATNPDNPSLGARSFGDDPQRVAELTAAMVRGLQGEGVAATLKHFPGDGAARTDPHHELPFLHIDRDRMEAVELVPFRAGVEAGAHLMMVGHYDVPSVTRRPGLPTSLSGEILRLIRRGLGFEGVVITDALDMGSVAQGPGQAIDAVAALRAGVDLLLCGPEGEDQDRIGSALALAIARGLVSRTSLARSARRVAALRRWVAAFPQPELDVAGCGPHRSLARELAERSVTLVRNDGGLLPLQLSPRHRVAAIMPAPADLTPADTSSKVAPGLGRALREHHPNVDEFVTGHPPSAAEIADLRARGAGYDLLVVGTIDAFRSPEQAALVAELLATGVPTVAVALRTPHDLAAYPRAGTYACSYSILPPSMEAIAAAMWGDIRFGGRLPASIPGLYPTGYGLGA